ncbi:hypothetical protein, partial [Vibrio sp. S9_S30]|uniref:hypothetical protein n=1 Tax=Vibrio sp. S9_S30 TaxID=2720226 RepID=UPI001EED8441
NLKCHTLAVRLKRLLERNEYTNSLGREAFCLHSMNSILTNKTCCNQTTIPKTPNQSKNLQERTENQTSKSGISNWHEIPQRLGLRRLFQLDTG